MSTGARKGKRQTYVLYARINAELHREVRLRAIHEDRTMENIIEEAVRNYLARPAQLGKVRS